MVDAQGQLLFRDDTFWPLPETSAWEAIRNDLLASFQQAVVDTLVSKTQRAVAQTGAQAIAVVGGVACNSALRRAMRAAGDTFGIPVLFPSPIFCTDNAAMIACAAAYRYQANPALYHQQQAVLDLDAHPNLGLSHVKNIVA
jgi:N6-L-threonylcarbamoyladenine synthase